MGPAPNLGFLVLSYFGEVRNRHLALGELGDDLEMPADSLNVRAEARQIDVGPLLQLRDGGLGYM